MNEFAKKWVAALKSGEFQQGRSCLRFENSFCCLGVACELAARDGIIPKPVLRRDGLYVYAGSPHYLPWDVQMALNLRSDKGEFEAGTGSFTDYLSVLNDKGKTFNQIAAVIESEPEGLFEKES